MTELRFTWDTEKAKENERKHGVTFDEARAVFNDEGALLIDDPDHSDDEERFVIVGFSSRARLVTVYHCYPVNGDVIRLISARRATRSESSQYLREQAQ
jgi:uncharacterized DUF497 family protein